MWWSTTLMTLDAQRIVPSWDIFKMKFKESYCPPSFYSSKASKFHNLKQGDMSVAEYADTFYAMLRYAPHVAASQVAVVESFIEGLNDHLHPFVSIGKPLNYLEAVEIAKRAEASLKRSAIELLPNIIIREGNNSINLVLNLFVHVGNNLRSLVLVLRVRGVQGTVVDIAIVDLTVIIVEASIPVISVLEFKGFAMFVVGRVILLKSVLVRRGNQPRQVVELKVIEFQKRPSLSISLVALRIRAEGKVVNRISHLFMDLP
ncbi:uncharacterized protein [Primulina huaijiensis]|uniref:uncharacterized protein n=1 Tax=Primulina huaijiensis TaxID=1492673 RepID=UPI003CC77978